MRVLHVDFEWRSKSSSIACSHHHLSMRRAANSSQRYINLLQLSSRYTPAPYSQIIRAMSDSAAPGPSSAVRPAPSLRDLQPPQHFGMKELNRDAFILPLTLTTARVPAVSVGSMRKNPAMRG